MRLGAETPCNTNSRSRVRYVPRRFWSRVGEPGFRVCVRTLNRHGFVAPAFYAGILRIATTPSARLKGGRYKIVPVLSSHTDFEARLLRAFLLTASAAEVRFSSRLRLAASLQ
jgi:hypothetical protein